MNFIEKLKLVFQDRMLRKRIIFTLAILGVTRILSVIPVPGIDASQLGALLSNSQFGQFLGLFNIFSGGGLSNLSIVMLGVGPYITGSIIMQLLTMMSPRLKAMYQEEGDAGRRKFTQYSRMLTIPLALIQGFSFIILLERQGVIPDLTPFQMGINLITIAAGSMFLMWLGELITEFGIGNGVSLIIFAGIVSGVPQGVSQLAFAYDPSQLTTYIALVLAALVVIYGVVIITESERPIPVTYAKRVRGARMYGGVSTYLPLRLNQAGVIPIIFALSILLFPQMIFQFLANTSNQIVVSISQAVLRVLANGWLYAAAYFVLVFLFTYFYTAVTFDPHQLSTNLQKNGAFIPGIRPGQSTSDHVSRILTRLTFVGALFLGIIAVLPLIIRAMTGITAIAIGGTALLIVVSVVLDLFKKIDAQVSMREY